MEQAGQSVSLWEECSHHCLVFADCTVQRLPGTTATKTCSRGLERICGLTASLAQQISSFVLFAAAGAAEASRGGEAGAGTEEAARGTKG